jgi:hypothetical protein
MNQANLARSLATVKDSMVRGDVLAAEPENSQVETLRDLVVQRVLFKARQFRKEKRGESFKRTEGE